MAARQGVQKYFFHIKQAVATDWKDLAFHLGFDESAIRNIEGRNRDDRSCCMDLLQEWRKKDDNGTNPTTTETLMEALSEAGLQHVLADLKRKFPELQQPRQETAGPFSGGQKKLFIVHSGEDKDSLVEPLAHEIVDQGVPKEHVFYDKWSIEPAASIKESIASAIRDGSYRLAVVVLSKDMMKEYWPRREFEEFFKRGITFFPIFYGVTPEEVRNEYSPTLADKRGVVIPKTGSRVDDDTLAGTASNIRRIFRNQLVHVHSWQDQSGLGLDYKALGEEDLVALETTRVFICENIDETVINKMETPYEKAIDMVNHIIEKKDKRMYDSLCDALRDQGQDFILREMQKAAYNFLRDKKEETTQESEHLTNITSAQDQSGPTKEEMVNVDPVVKVVILGETEAGKTSLCKTIIEGQNVMELKADRTIGVDIRRYQDKESNIAFEIYDFGGHDVYHYTHRFFLTRHAIYVTSTDLPSYNSAEFQKRLGTWLTSVTTHVMNPAIIVVGTKADQFDPNTAKEDIEKTCSQIKTDIKNFEKSSRDLLMADIKRCQDALDRISKGDHPGEHFTGLSKEDIADKKASLETLLKGRPTSLQEVEVIPVSVNPENPQGLDKLLTKMAEMTKDKTLFPNISQQVPKSWIDLRHKLKETEDEKYTTLDDCVELAGSLKMTKEDVLNALSYWYVAGQILFYSNIEEVENLIFPDPTGILELFKDLFRHNMETYLAGVAPGNEDFQQASTTFLKTGTADEVFLQGVLGNKRKDFDVMFPILKHFGLCFSGSVKFPPQLPELSDEDMSNHWPELEPSHVEVTVNIDYHAEPPVGLTESMISRIASSDVGETSSKVLRKNTVILHSKRNSAAVLCKRCSQTTDQIKVRAEPNIAWKLCQNLGKLIQDAQDEYLALHCTINVRQQNGMFLKELPFEVLKLYTPAELIELSQGKIKGPLIADVEKPTEQKTNASFGKYYIENQLYEKICDQVGPEWLRLGTALSISTSALDNIQYSGYGNDAQRVFQTLKVFWAKAAYGHLYKLKRLQDVLLGMGKTDLSKAAENILANYTEQLSVLTVIPEEITDDQGTVTWNLSLSREGKYVCSKTDLGVITPYPLDVTYKTDNWSDHWKEPDENWVAVGPLFNIQCDGVEGQVSLLLPHGLDLEGKTDLTQEHAKVVHLVPGMLPELLEAEITTTHLVTQFKKGSQFGAVFDRSVAYSIPRKALFSVFVSPDKSHGTRLRAYIVSNLKTVEQALKEDELQGKRKFEYWDHIICSLKPGETYCLEGTVLNGNNEVDIKPKIPAGVEFDDTVDTSGYYQPFQITVRRSTEATDAELELQLDLLNTDGGNVGTFTDFIDDGDFLGSDSGLSSDSTLATSGFVPDLPEEQLKFLRFISSLLGINFIPLVDKEAERQRLREISDWEKTFSSDQVFSISSEADDLINKRKGAVCQIEWPNGGRGTGFLIGKREIMTNDHVCQHMLNASRTNSDRNCYKATFEVAGSKHSFLFSDRLYLCRDDVSRLDYAILELDSEPDRSLIPPLGRFISGITEATRFVVVIGYPSGGPKQLDYAHMAHIDDTFAIHVQFGNPDAPAPHPDMASYQTHSMYFGSSGSPGFDKDANVILLHTKGNFPFYNRTSVIEQGIKLTSIVEHARSNLTGAKFDELFPGYSSHGNSLFRGDELMEVGEGV